MNEPQDFPLREYSLYIVYEGFVTYMMALANMEEHLEQVRLSKALH